jgi:hypothetical protein
MYWLDLNSRWLDISRLTHLAKPTTLRDQQLEPMVRKCEGLPPLLKCLKPSGAQYMTLHITIGWRKFKICQFGSANDFGQHFWKDCGGWYKAVLGHFSHFLWEPLGFVFFNLLRTWLGINLKKILSQSVLRHAGFHKCNNSQFLHLFFTTQLLNFIIIIISVSQVRRYFKI